MNIFSRITARTMKLNRTRTIVTIIGVILSAAMITALATFSVSFQKFLIDYSISRDGNWHIQAKSISRQQAEELSKNQEVANAAAVTELGYALFAPVSENSPEIPYLYVQSLSQKALKMLPIDLAEGRMPESEEEILIPSYLKANEEEEQTTKVGDTLTLELGERTFEGEHLTQNHGLIDGEDGERETFVPKETRTFQVVGVYNSWPGASYGGAGYDVLAGPTEGGGSYFDLYLELKQPREVYQFAKEYLGDEGVIYNDSLLRWQGVSDNGNFYQVVGTLMAILVLVIMAGSISLIYNAFSISLRERSTQFGLLSSLGATKKQLRSSMRYEALLVCAAGIPTGILAGIGGIGITLHYIGKDITNLIHGTRSGMELVVSGWAILAAALLAFVTVMISVWLPSRRIRKISPMEAIRANQDIKIRPKEVKTRAWVFKVFGLEGMMADKNYKRDRKKYRATVVSLTMSIVLFTTVALFRSYLVATGAFVLDAPSAELEYRFYGEETEGQKEQIEGILQKAQGVTSIFSYQSTYLLMEVPKDWVSERYLQAAGSGGETEDGKVYLEASVRVLSDDQFEKIARSQGANPKAYADSNQLPLLYLNEVRSYNPNTQRYEKLEIFQSGKGQTFAAGKFNYDNDVVEFEQVCQAELCDPITDLSDEVEESLEVEDSQPLILVSQSIYDKHLKNLDGPYGTYKIQCEKPHEAYDEIQDELEQRGLSDMGYLENLAEQYESDRSALAAIDVLTYGFIILICLIAVANVFNTISTNLMLRRKEFAMLRSMGMSPKGFRKMMSYECLIYGLRSICYGVFLTVIISLAIQNAIGAGADTEFLMPWGYLGGAVLAVFFVVGMTMIYTMCKIRNHRIVDELKMS